MIGSAPSSAWWAASAASKSWSERSLWAAATADIASIGPPAFCPGLPCTKRVDVVGRHQL